MSAAVRGRTVRHVQHVMGMPISLAMRGRHAADGTGRAAWTEAMAVRRAVDHVFSTYRADSVVSRLGRGDLRQADCPSEVAEVLELGATAERDSGGAFSCYRPGRDGRIAFDPSGVVKGWAAERAAGALRELAGTDGLLPVRRWRHRLPHPRPGRPAVADRHRGPGRHRRDRRLRPGRGRGAVAADQARPHRSGHLGRRLHVAGPRSGRGVTDRPGPRRCRRGCQPCGAAHRWSRASRATSRVLRTPRSRRICPASP